VGLVYDWGCRSMCIIDKLCYGNIYIALFEILEGGRWLVKRKRWLNYCH
jgi:hypothetical protein